MTETVDEVAAPVASTATKTLTRAAEQVTRPAVETVAAVPIVGERTATAVETAAGDALRVVDTGVGGVDKTLSSQPVAEIVDPLLDSVESLPIAGSIVGELRPTIASGTTAADRVLDSAGSLVVATVDQIGPLPQGPDAVDATIPETPRTNGPITSGPVAISQTQRATTSTRSDVPGVSLGPPSASAHPESNGVSGDDGDDRIPLRSGAPPGPTNSPAPGPAGSGGGGTSAAMTADADPLSSSAAERSTGASDDALPPSPVYDTDASPD